MTSRRWMLVGSAGLAATLALPARSTTPPAFVRRDGTRFTRAGQPYRFVGANIWYAAWLGARDPVRLGRELDALAASGVTNLRILAGAEEGPLRNSVKPGFRGKGPEGNAALLSGLDRALAEIGARGMTAVLYLTNFWEWSGGMSTYLWYDTGSYIDMGDPAHPWPAFANASSRFYGNRNAVKLYHDWVRAIVGRTNGVTGIAYRNDPAIMAWQLCNEPRPGGTPEDAAPKLPGFYAWIRDTARLIKGIDPNHLVSIGSEGLKGTVESTEIFRASHAIAEIDYATAHIWPLNWSWIDARDLAGTAAAGEAKVREYLDQHRALASQIGKPLVIEEFGYPRDGGGYDAVAATRYRDRYYRLIFAAVEDSVRTGGPVQGSNFWAWNGAGRAAHGDHRYRHGDPLLGDPPHEPQGWYGVYDSDESTRTLIADHARALAVIGAPIAR